MPTELNRLERKIDELAAAVLPELAKIGRLEERIAAYMGIAERIEQENRQGVSELKERCADHEARLRTLEAVKTADLDTRLRALETATAVTGQRNRVADGAAVKLGIPLLLFVLGILVAEWKYSRQPAQVTVTTAPIINPPKAAP